MMKQILIGALSVILGSSLYAGDLSESQKFIGVEIGITEVQGDGPSEDASNLSNGTSFGVRLGAQNEEWRTMVGLQYFDAEGRNVEKLYGSIDYFFLSRGASSEMILKPFIGVNVGYANYESNEVDANGFTYGGEAGVIVDVLENMNVDIGYKYSLSNSDVFDHSADVFFGLNYQY